AHRSRGGAWPRQPPRTPEAPAPSSTPRGGARRSRSARALGDFTAQGSGRLRRGLGSAAALARGRRFRRRRAHRCFGGARRCVVARCVAAGGVALRCLGVAGLGACAGRLRAIAGGGGRGYSLAGGELGEELVEQCLVVLLELLGARFEVFLGALARGDLRRQLAARRFVLGDLLFERAAVAPGERGRAERGAALGLVALERGGDGLFLGERVVELGAVEREPHVRDEARPGQRVDLFLERVDAALTQLVGAGAQIAVRRVARAQPLFELALDGAIGGARRRARQRVHPFLRAPLPF